MKRQAPTHTKPHTKPNQQYQILPPQAPKSNFPSPAGREARRVYVCVAVQEGRVGRGVMRGCEGWGTLDVRFDGGRRRHEEVYGGGLSNIFRGVTAAAVCMFCGLAGGVVWLFV